MASDPLSLGIISASIGWFHVLTLFLFWRVSSQPKGAFLWIVAMAIFSTTFVLLGMRLSWGSVTGTVILPNALVLVAQAMVLSGICKFLEVRFPVRITIGVFALYTLIFPVFAYWHQDIMIRTVIMSSLIMTMHISIAWPLISSRSPRPKSHSIAAGVFMFMAANDAIRLIQGLTLEWNKTEMYDPLIMGTIMVTSLMATPLVSFAFVILIIEREVLLRKHADHKLRIAEEELTRQRLLRE